jgi:ribosome-associated heat shock protein Hsp15
MTGLRLDRWLHAARFLKSRTLAAAACEGGKVDVNGQAAKPARTIHPGDLIEITLPAGRRTAKVLAVAARRGPASEASKLYQDLTPPAPPKAERTLPPVFRARGAGRPTKRERRLLDRLGRRR